MNAIRYFVLAVVLAGTPAAADERPVNFANDVVPVLTRAGCNAGGCHGKQAGRNGFKLSLFGFDPDFDYHALTREGRGRRIFPAVPEQSLLLLKAVNRVPHGGGKRFDESSDEFRLIHRWIQQGLPVSEPNAPTLVGIEMRPEVKGLAKRAAQQVTVTASYSDGSTRDVTHLALYSSNAEALTKVDENGLIQTTQIGGESTVMANYMGYVANCRITVPVNAAHDEIHQSLAKWKEANAKTGRFIDNLVAAKWERLNLAPSPVCTDATFLRRAFLDCIGRLPTVTEAREFLQDSSPAKRRELVDDLLTRPEYADFWAVKWADLLKINSENLGAKNAQLFDSWLREAFARNLPYDEILRRLLTAQGNSYRERSTNFFKAFSKPNDLTIAVSQVFLGIRLECAQCHHHPFEKWGQDDFYGLAAFFPRLARKRGTGGEELLYVGTRGDVKHPRTGEVVLPQVLGGEPLEIDPQFDRRTALADWMTRPENPYVARTLVNRFWGHFMGVGLVDPIDDMRDTNPASNRELLNELARDFVAHDFDIKHLIRTITRSQAYGLSSLPNRWNVRDNDNFSRAYRKRIPAEVLLDAVCDVTEVPESFAGMPPGTRAIELWDNRLPSGFLDIFGRPERKTVCDCERTAETSLTQVLHLMNSPQLNEKIQSPIGRADRLARSELSPDGIIDELYLAAFSRLPTAGERRAAAAVFVSPNAADRRRATEDIMWALLNTAEFVLNH